ncbi:response regulator [Desulfatibacillum alkenivorans]|jgi:DNA-binding NtrC family response regulator
MLMDGAHFLLVDDEKVFVEALAQRLEARGFKVDCAFSGAEALTQLEKDRSIDIVVLDRRMPDLDGVQAMKEIKKAHPLVEVIILTGHAEIDSAVEAVKHGAFDYLEKPCDIDQLLLKARQAFARKTEREEKIREVRMKPYLSPKERDALIAKILEN